jgi:hypothetical protein
VSTKEGGKRACIRPTRRRYKPVGIRHQKKVDRKCVLDSTRRMGKTVRISAFLNMLQNSRFTHQASHMHASQILLYSTRGSTAPPTRQTGTPEIAHNVVMPTPVSTDDVPPVTSNTYPYRGSDTCQLRQITYCTPQPLLPALDSATRHSTRRASSHTTCRHSTLDRACSNLTVSLHIAHYIFHIGMTPVTHQWEVFTGALANGGVVSVDDQVLRMRQR